MTCPCENKCAGKNPPAILAVEQPCEPVLFHRVDYPANLGDDTTVDVNTLDYRNVLLVFANQHAYLYSSDGIPTFISLGDFNTEVIEQKLAELGIQLADETTARTQADETLEDSIAANSNEIVEIKTEINQINQTQSENFEQLNNTLSGLENQTVQKDTGVSGDNSTVTITKKLGALGSNDTTETGLPLPVASETSAGVMNAATYASVQTNAENIDSILNGAVLVEGLPASPTQDELTMQWKAETGKTTLVNRASIYDKTNGKIWYYYTNVNEWEPADIQNPEITVSQATNEALGIVKGSTEEGQVAVEANGSMSLNGYDAINSNIENLQSEMPKLPAGMVYDFVSPAGDNNPSTADNANITARVVETATGNVTSGTLMLPMASATQAGSITADNKQKLDNLPAITEIGENLELTDEGVLNAPGGEIEVPKVPNRVVGGDSPNAMAIFSQNSPNTVALQLRSTDTQTGSSGIYLQTATLGSATTERAGTMSSADKSKLDSLLAIKSLNDSLSLDENGQLSVVGGGSDVNLLTSYTATSELGDNDVYNAEYVNGRLNGGGVNIGLRASSQAPSISIGRDSVATGAGRAVAIGLEAEAVGAAGGNSIAVGARAKAQTDNAVALGAYTQANKNNSVALGSYSIVTREREVSIADPNATSTSVPKTRYLANVTAGVLDTDAVNLKQMQDYVAENAGNPFTEMETTRVQNLPPAVVTGFEDTTYGTDTITMHLDTKDLATGGVSVQELMLEGATPNTTEEGGHAGLMTAFQATQLAALAEGGAGGGQLTADEVTKVQNLGTGSLTNMEGVTQTEESVEIEFGRQNLVAGGSTTQTATIAAATTEEAGVMTPAMVTQLNSLTPVVAATAEEITAAWEAA